MWKELAGDAPLVFQAPRTRVRGKPVFVEDAVMSHKGVYRLTRIPSVLSTSSAWPLPRDTRFVK